jgi:hypothetical protein
VPTETPDIIREHVDEGASFPELARRHGIPQTTMHNVFVRASRTELDALEEALHAGGIHFSVPTGDIEEFRCLTRRVLWVIKELHNRGIVLNIRTTGAEDAIHYEMRIA